MRHPGIAVVAAQLRALGETLDRYPPHDRRAALNGLCGCLECKAKLLASRGLPASTLGGSGGRSSDTTSSTERNAGLTGPDGDLTPPRFAGVDEKLAELVAVLHLSAGELSSMARTISAHASDEDAVRPGQGPCGDGCGHVCKPWKDPEDRLRSNLAPKCYRAWLRWRAEYTEQYGPLTVADFVTARRRERGGQVAS